MILTNVKCDYADIDKIIYDKVNTRALHQLLIIVPTNRKVRYLKRDIISSAPDGTVSQMYLDTLATLSTKLFEEARDFEAKFLSEATAVILISQAFNEVELKYFNNYKNEVPRGTLELVRNVIAEYKKHGITPSDILIESRLLTGSEKLKAVDISNIYSVYESKSKELRTFEQGDIYQYLINLNQTTLINSYRFVYPQANTIIINGFDEFSQSEIELITKLSSISGISLYISFDYYKYNSEIFSHLENCYKKLILNGFVEVEDRSPSMIDDFRKTIRENLFSNKQSVPKYPRLELTKLIASSSVIETEAIAKEIKRLISKENVSTDEICVAFNMISEHSAMVRDVFNSYGIPYNLTDRYNLSNSAPVIALINFLEILENDFYYKNIFRALSGRWIEFKGIDLSNLLAVSANLKIVAGFNQWISSIENALEQIQNDFDEQSRFLKAWQYEKAFTDLKNIEKFLLPFKKKLTFGDFKVKVLSLISSLRFNSKLINDDPDLIEKNVKAITVLSDTIDELFALLEDEYGKEKKFPLSFFTSEIRTALLFSRYNIKERHGKGVLVTSINEIRGLRFKYLFLGGMVDGEFPTRHQPAIFFSGEHRRKRDEVRHLLEERYRFYQVLCVPEKYLFISYPVKGDKKELAESSFITDLEKLYIIQKKNESDYSHLIYSKEEFLKNIVFSEQEIKLDKAIKNKVENSVRIDSQRKNNPFAESEYSGFIKEKLNEQAKEKLVSLTEKEYSASQLEQYAKCPFRYFVSRILMLERIEEPSEELEVFEIGSLVHSILHKFYKELKDNNIILQGCSDAEFKKSEKLLFKIAGDKVGLIKFASPSAFYEREKIFGINGKKENSILYQFLLSERNNDDGYIPEYFEYEFGNINKGSSEIIVESIKLRGKVDRIDMNEKQKLFKVIDYKLGGAKPSKEDLTQGISLQLPLYMYASKMLIEAESNLVYKPAAAEIFSLKLTENDFGRKGLSIESKRNLSEDQLLEMNERIIEIALESISKYVNKIVEGDFRLSQLENRESKVCRYCEFKSICRIQEIC